MVQYSGVKYSIVRYTTNMRIIHSGFKAQDKGEFRNHGLWDSYVHVVVQNPQYNTVDDRTPASPKKNCTAILLTSLVEGHAGLTSSAVGSLAVESLSRILYRTRGFLGTLPH